MRKLLGTALAIALFVQPGLANAELLKNLKLSGQIDLQTQASRNVSDFVTRHDPSVRDGESQDTIGAVGEANYHSGRIHPDQPNGGATYRSYNDRLNNAQTRLMVGLDWDLLDDVKAQIGLVKRSRTWGTTGGVNTTLLTDANSQSIDGSGPATVFGSVYVDRANVKIEKVMGNMDVTIGRQHFGEPGDLVIYFGPSDKMHHGLPADSIDAVRVDVMSLPMFNITAMAGKTAGSSLATTNPNLCRDGADSDADGTVDEADECAPAADSDVRGFNFSLKDVENVNVDAFIWSRITHSRSRLGSTTPTASDAAFPATYPANIDANTGGNDSLYVWGAKTKVIMGGFTAKFYLAVNAGQNRLPANIAIDRGAGTAVTNDEHDGDTADVGDQFRPQVGTYRGIAWTADASYTHDAEGIASFTPWFHLGWGTGRSNLMDNQNEGFTAINSDYRPGTIYGRFSSLSSSPLGGALPCVMGTMGCTNANAGVGNTQLGLGVATVHNGGLGLANPGLNNRIVWGAGAKITPAFANQMTIAVSWYDFRFQKNTADGVLWCNEDGSNGCNAFGSAAGGQFFEKQTIPNSTGVGENYNIGTLPGGGFGSGRGQKHIGSEVDLDLTWKHTDNVMLGAGVASFRPGKYIQELVRDTYNVAAAEGAGNRVSVNPVVLAYGDVRIKF